MFGISFATRGIYGGVEWIFTWSNYSRLADPLYGNIYVRSVLFAGLTTLVCLILGFPLAYSIARAPQQWQPLLFVLVLIPFWTNFLVINRANNTNPIKTKEIAAPNGQSRMTRNSC